MSLTIPFTARRGRKHSPDTIIRNLRAENVTLLNRQAAADDFFEILMGDVVTTNAALEQEQQLRGEAEEAVDQMRKERDEWREAALALRARFGPQLAAEANAEAITVPPMIRDTSDPADQATGPIDVRQLRAEYAPPVPLHQAPFATVDPGRVPSWAVRDEPAEGVAS